MQFNYRLKRQSERIGDVTVELECIEDLNRTIDDLFVELERTGNAALLEELCPYFGVVWPSARALALQVAELGPSEFTGRRVLEVGCGLALPSLYLAKVGARVTATDFHPEVPRFLERNLALNGIRELRYLPFHWVGDALIEGAGKYDWVIASDVLYEKQHPEQVARAMAGSVSPRGRILLADPARPYLQRFADEMVRLGFRYESVIRKVPDQPVPKEIFLLKFEALKAGK